jgi:vesicle-fusing ATPase
MRKLLYVALDEKVTCRPFAQTPDTIYATSAKIKISFLKQSQRTKMNFEAKDLFAKWKEEMNKFPLNVNMEFYVKIDGVYFTFKVDEILGATTKEVADGVESKPVNAALFNASLTVIKFIKGDNEPITIADDSNGGGATLFKPNWDFQNMGIGGLDDQFITLFRRAFASRIFPTSVVKQMGIQHVKGILLYGPPGTGKTLMARQIGKMLNCADPKIVNGPELLNKFVGESEKNVRELFADAKKDQEENGDEAALHLIIFDEFDSLAKKRGRSSDNTGTEDRIVNQLLSMMDGVDALNDILLIGMTNRRDLIDSALLRPGRFEVQIEVNLPDEKGRRQIFNIHTSALKESKRLSHDVDIDELARETPNYTGAEIAGVVKSAVSFAMNENIDIKDLSHVKTDSLMVTRQHLMMALDECKPAFGIEEDILEKLCVRGIINYSELFKDKRDTLARYIDTLRNDEHQSLMSFCISGPAASGLTAYAAQTCKDGGFNFVRAIQAKEFIGVSDDKAASIILSIFEDAYKSSFSAIIIDDLDMIVEYSPIGPRYSNKMLQAILVLLKTAPPAGRKLAIFVTTSKRESMAEIGLESRFFYEEVYLNELSTYDELKNVIDVIAPNKLTMTSEDEEDANKFFTTKHIGIKKAIEAIDFAVYQAKDQPLTWKELKFAISTHVSPIN